MYFTAGTGYAYRSQSPRRRRHCSHHMIFTARAGYAYRSRSSRRQSHCCHRRLFTELDMRIAPGSREDGRISAAVASPPREPGRRSVLGPRVYHTSRKNSCGSSTTSSLEAPTTFRHDSQDVRVALRCVYGNTGPSGSSWALRSRSLRKTGRNPPLCKNNE